MVSESQEEYLKLFPDDKTVVIGPFDPQAKETGERIIKDIIDVMPDAEISFEGSASLGLAGQNDIDIKILTSLDRYDTLTPVIAKLYGEPARKGTSVKWEFISDGFEVELTLSNKESSRVQEHHRVFELLSQHEDLRHEYEQMKLPFCEQNFKEYMRKKYAFFNRILGME